MTFADLQKKAESLYLADIAANNGAPLNAPYQLRHENERYVARVQTVRIEGEKDDHHDILIERPVAHIGRFTPTIPE